ncbi:fluoride efflux transporter CrcB [Bacillus methanolicus]|uniref:fluoride efflux transporter CrcB n=1 Tax=Bacillus methanolicus TaxID=1471 RepID=UPI00200DA4BF|nr:fluoride efflux transporter CrcB [Bacillus methanolicus]UQD52082.1 fluoride efflux transporter CrcB [Bacillus methanolicus]
MMKILLVSFGGFFGAVSRYFISRKLNGHKSKIPFGTLTVNLLGSFLLGILIGKNFGEAVYLLLGIGFMGAFTTFSTLKAETLQLFEQKETFKSAFYLAITYIVGIIAGLLGLVIGRS